MKIPLRIILLLLIIVMLSVGFINARDFRIKIPEFTPSDEALADFGNVRSIIQDYGTATGSLTGFFISSDSDDFKIDYPTANELFSASDLIVKISPTGIREMHRGTILSEVIIEEVITENGSVDNGDVIYIYEPISIHPFSLPGTYSQYINYYGNCNIMQTDRSYIACLRFFAKPEGYEYSDIETRTYLVAIYPHGIFPNVEPEEFVEVTEGISYSLSYRDAQQYDVVALNESDFNEYLKMRNDLFNLLNR